MPHFRQGNLQKIFENNRKWVEESLEKDPSYFEKLKTGQKPEYLYIGCSDSRVPAQEIMGLRAGQCFVARNIANLVVNTDMSLLSVLEYAVHYLEVPDIFVVGHYGCGGVKAAMTKKDHGLLENWIHNIRDVQRIHKAELDAITDETQRWNRMVELNVQEQCMNLFHNPIVQRKQIASGIPRIHGFVYDIGEGILKKLDLDFRALFEVTSSIYSLYDFPEEMEKGVDPLAALSKSASFRTQQELEENFEKNKADSTALPPPPSDKPAGLPLGTPRIT